jgi:hypothetical protein
MNFYLLSYVIYETKVINVCRTKKTEEFPKKYIYMGFLSLIAFYFAIDCLAVFTIFSVVMPKPA